MTTVKAPGETYQALASAGVAKATMPMNKALHSAFMGGWYVAIGGVFALVVAGALDLPAPIKKLVIGLIFPIGLVFILQARNSAPRPPHAQQSPARPLARAARRRRAPAC